MLIKDKLSRISLQSLIPSKKIPQPVIATEEPLSSSPFVMPKNTAAEAPFTGRVKELDLLRALYREVISVKHAGGNPKDDLNKPLVIGIKGEAGIGKSRLLTEFQKNITASNHKKNFIYSAGCVSSGQEAYGLFRGFFSESNLLKQAVTSERKTLIQNKISENILNLAREARRNELPLVILLEDMQWADELSLAALDHFLSAINLTAAEEGILLFLLLNYRPAFKPGRIIRKDCRLVEIELKGFSESESKQFISKLTGSKKISANTVELISRRSEGNPFNIEELCRSIDGNAKHLKLPATVKRLLADKVSQLEKDERAVLIIASVLGRKFSLKLLNAILKKAGKQSADADVMSRLEERKYLVNLTSDVYEFRHDLLHEIIYRELKKELKKNVHALAAASIEETYSAKLSAHYYELVRHYEAAGDEPNTIKYLEKAGDKARDNYENDRAERYYKKLLKFESIFEISILFKLGDVYKQSDSWEKEIHLYNNLLFNFKKIKPSERAECYKRIGNIFNYKGEYDDALRYFKRSYDIYKRLLNMREILIIREKIAKVLVNTGKLSEALTEYKLIYQKSLNQGLDVELERSLNGIGIIYAKQGRYNESIKLLNEYLNKAAEKKDKIGIGRALLNKGEIFIRLGEYNKAEHTYNDAIAVFNSLNKIHDLGLCYSNLAAIQFYRSNYKKALLYNAKNLKIMQYLGDKAGVARASGIRGSCFINSGQYASALKCLNVQLKLAHSLGRLPSAALAHGNLAVVYIEMGNFKTAQYHLNIQLRLDTKTRNIEGMVRGLCNLGYMYRYQDKFTIALRFFRKALRLESTRSDAANLKLIVTSILDILNEKKKFADAELITDKFQYLINKTCPGIYDVSLLISQFNNNIRKSELSHKDRDCERIKDKIFTFYSDSRRRLSDNESRALLEYEVWRLLIALPEMTRSGNYLNSNRIEALKLYRFLNTSKPKLEYRYKIKKLTI